MKRYNTPHRSRVVKTRLTDEEYADFTARLAPYGMSQSEFIRQAITRATIRSFPNCKQNCPTSGSITLTGYPAISLPLGGNTRTMQPLSADGWLTIPLKLPRKGAYPITATRREKVYETSF